MTPKEAAQPRRVGEVETAHEKPLSEYVEDLCKGYGQYARPDAETRRVVDESMGQTSLTGLLYQSRDEA